jgi:hypothetical protein
VGVQLARVFDRSELEGPRGADVRVRIVVPVEWLTGGVRVEVLLPRLAICATCDAGGCDLCDRGGAIATRGRKEPGEIVEVELPPRAEGATLRVRGHGGTSTEEGLERGLLLLEVRPGSAVSEGVTLVFAPAPPEEESPAPQQDPGIAAPRTSWVPWLLWGLALVLLAWWVSR